MGLDGTIRSAIKLANSITADLQDTVTREPFDSYDEFGKPSYRSAQTLHAIVEKKQRLVKLKDGREVQSRSTITFLVPVSIDTRDKLTLSDGTVGQILDSDGLMDPTTSVPYFASVYIG